jgi:hypothetical protein
MWTLSDTDLSGVITGILQKNEEGEVGLFYVRVKIAYK